MARRYAMIVIRKDTNSITLAMADPLDVRALDAVRLETKCRVRKAVASRSDIIECIDRSYHAPSTLAKSMDSLIAVETSLDGDPAVTGSHDAHIQVDQLKLEASDVPVVRFVNILLMRAVQERASDIHVEPGTKVLPKEQVSTALSCKELLDKVQNDAKMYRKEVSAEAEELKAISAREGFDEGLRKWAQQIALLEQELKTVRDEMTKAIVPIAIQAAKKVVGQELISNEDTIVGIVRSALKSVTGHRKITIYVCKDDASNLEKHKDRLKAMFERLDSLTILERADIERGGCVVETEGGIINAQLDRQWELLEQAFQKLLDPQAAKARKMFRK